MHPMNKVLLEEINLAQGKLGFVGINYFINRWKSNRLPRCNKTRQLIMDACKDYVEIYKAPNGDVAVRTKEFAFGALSEREEFKVV